MKKFLIALLVVVLAGVGIGAYMWNKPPETVDDKKATAVNAEVLSKAFTTNETTANATYLNQVLEVTGTIAEVNKNQDGKTVVILGVSDPLSGIQCTMRDDNVRTAVGKTITVKGFCNGYTLVVLLSDCIVKP